ncbi:MAG: hypothetical protein AAB416_02745 [Patescibacteria group bacterium]
MPQSVQELFLNIQSLKQKQRELRKMVKDALDASGELRGVKDELEIARERKKSLEAKIKSQFESELTKLDDLKIDLETESGELSDAVLVVLMRGETVQVRDEKNNPYNLSLKVVFKKSDEVESY